MRLKFWYDAIETIYKPKTNDIKLPNHPVVKELNDAIHKYNLPKLYFSRLIKVRERPANISFVTIKELEQYAEESVSSIYYLLAKIVGIENVDMDHAVSHLGKAQGIVNMLRAQRYQDRGKALCIPQEIMIKHGVNQERIIRDKVGDKGVQDCTFEIASVAFSHLEKVDFYQLFIKIKFSNLYPF